MAITWRNIDAPDFSRAAAIQQQGFNNIQNSASVLLNLADEQRALNIKQEEMDKELNTYNLLDQIRTADDEAYKNMSLSGLMGSVDGKVDQALLYQGLKEKDDSVYTQALRKLELESKGISVKDQKTSSKFLESKELAALGLSQAQLKGMNLENAFGTATFDARVDALLLGNEISREQAEGLRQQNKLAKATFEANVANANLQPEATLAQINATRASTEQTKELTKQEKLNTEFARTTFKDRIAKAVADRQLTQAQADQALLNFNLSKDTYDSNVQAKELANKYAEETIRNAQVSTSRTEALLPGELTAQELSNQGTSLTNTGTALDNQFKTSTLGSRVTTANIGADTAKLELEAQRTSNELAAALLPEKVKEAQLANQYNELALPEKLKEVQLANTFAAQSNPEKVRQLQLENQFASGSLADRLMQTGQQTTINDQQIAGNQQTIDQTEITNPIAVEQAQASLVSTKTANELAAQKLTDGDMTKTIANAAGEFGMKAYTELGAANDRQIQEYAMKTGKELGLTGRHLTEFVNSGTKLASEYRGIKGDEKEVMDTALGSVETAYESSLDSLKTNKEAALAEYHVDKGIAPGASLEAQNGAIAALVQQFPPSNFATNSGQGPNLSIEIQNIINDVIVEENKNNPDGETIDMLPDVVVKSAIQIGVGIHINPELWGGDKADTSKLKQTLKDNLLKYNINERNRGIQKKINSEYYEAVSGLTTAATEDKLAIIQSKGDVAKLSKVIEASRK